jgi:DNA-directed RNA polymerase subunit RPC12/RpoP
MYRCAKCKERVRGDINNVGIQCTVCGSKMFYKERNPSKKDMKDI